MDSLPLEILEIIFHQFSSLTDIQSCYKTCVKWRHIITKLFCNNRNVLVAGGFPGEFDLYTTTEKFKYVEILDLIDAKVIYDYDHGCEISGLENQSIMISRGPTSGILKNNEQEDKIVICGGGSRGVILGCGQICKSFDLLKRRFNTSSVQLNENTLWLTGGNGRCEEKTTEFISLHKPPVKGPDLPLAITAHSMVKVDSKTIYIIGGRRGQESHFTKETWIFDPTNNFKMKKGPCMKKARNQGISCAKMKIGGKIFVVAVGVTYHRYDPGPLGGGICEDGQPIDSVELLDTSNLEKGWRIGPKLPFNMSGVAMVSSPTGRGVIIIGGRRPDHVSDTGHALIELSGDSIESLKWTFLEQKINYKRFSHTALIIPNQLVNDLTRKSVATKRKLSG